MNRKRGVKHRRVVNSNSIERPHTITVQEIYDELCSHLSVDTAALHVAIIRNLLNVTLAVNKGAFQSLILRAAAIVLDAKYYKDNIRHCNYIYIINTLGGKIDIVPTKGLSKNSWQYFAAFRTQEDAILAVKILKHFKDYYGE